MPKLKAKQPLKSKTTLKASKKPRKQKLPTITILRRRADKIFSLAVRLRDGKVRGDGQWWSQCITCGKWNLTSKTHAGHFMKRGRLATRWDYENVNAQCAGCNTFRDGEQYKYALEIDLKYGTGTAKKLHDLSKQDFRPTRPFLEEIISTAQNEVDFYLKEKT